MDILQSVKDYYGNVLKSNKDLKTTACCTSDSIPAYLKEILPEIAHEVTSKFYGCGSPIPLVLDGMRVLDVGCGTGRDVYLAARLVGEGGFVSGIDMTEEQIGVAKKHIREHTKRFGYPKENVQFIHDYIETLPKHFSGESLDLVMSNCVINLVKDKEGVVNQIYKILKFGGEFYFSDIYADRRVPEELRENPVLYGECLGGALYYKDFERIARKAGFIDPRIISKEVVDITNDKIKDLIGNITFYSITYRLWKLRGMEDGCEDYGRIATYLGTVPEAPHRFVLDNTHLFEKNRPERVCGNTARMLMDTRFKDIFRVTGSFDEHFGLFEGCGTTAYFSQNNGSNGSCC